MNMRNRLIGINQSLYHQVTNTPHTLTYNLVWLYLLDTKGGKIRFVIYLLLSCVTFNKEKKRATKLKKQKHTISSKN